VALRYGGGGILVYWHVEEKYVVVHSQVLKASASEVAAMVEGAVRHGTTMNLAGNYADSHGQSEIGFGITRLLGIGRPARRTGSRAWPRHCIARSAGT
jgi:TnpA family transposase